MFAFLQVVGLKCSVLRSDCFEINVPNPEVKLVRNTDLAFTEAHLTDLKPEKLYIALFFVFCRETA